MQVVPDCVRLIVCPPTVRVVDRGVLEAAFDDTFTPMDPLPLPDPLLTVAHVDALEAVQEQLAAFAVMPIVPIPPAWPKGLPRAEVSTVTLQDSPC
jgi:hypothetical protein